MATMPVMLAMRIHLKIWKICQYRIRTETFMKQIAKGRKISTRRDNWLLSFRRHFQDLVGDLPQAAIW